MNRIIMQAGVMVLLVLAISIGVNAQSAQQYQAEIPFSFVAAGKHYAAGQYSVGPLSQVSSPGGIAIRDRRTGNARLLGVAWLPGNNNPSKLGTITFLKVDGEYRLTQISTATFNMNLKGRGVKSQDMAQAAPSDSKAVMVALNR